MNQSNMIAEMGALLALQAKFNKNRIGFGKFRDTKKKINRGVRKNRKIMCKDSRRANR